ncbi:hypothetical protein [Geobacillus subterraneus]|uniref:Uncharacterized protein n=1 Tax=Geobacillus subterraneus TaxID=129338 RepID=A0A679G1M5_9BACL|nr:hypothetical protein [Geobacillus subterraneus]BBW98994.1 hypothetical protein GsuE55_38270 [Geobacillus subterraneus]
MAYLFLEKEELLDILGGDEIVFCEQDQEEWVWMGQEKKKLWDCCSSLTNSLGEIGNLLQEGYDVEEINGQVGYLFLLRI